MKERTERGERVLFKHILPIFFSLGSLEYVLFSFINLNREIGIIVSTKQETNEYMMLRKLNLRELRLFSYKSEDQVFLFVID